VKNVVVELNTEQDRVTLRIKDNGQGFDMTGPALSVSSGLSIMRERSILLKGTFSLSSAPGKGTEITVALPI
jgi:two-component system NarL family sensor kinase